tara:strand:+ start:358 stop:486 length:129 start_codon:yes stop_codon:yes gene_type:complete
MELSMILLNIFTFIAAFAVSSATGNDMYGFFTFLLLLAIIWL